jgi:hypothetical protein
MLADVREVLHARRATLFGLELVTAHFPALPCICGSPDSYGLDDRGKIPARDEICPPQRRDRLWGSSSLVSKWVSRAFSPVVKWPELKAHRSPPYSSEVKNGGAIPPFPPFPTIPSWRDA